MPDAHLEASTLATKRTRSARHLRARLTPEAVEHYRVGNAQALHLELRLAPWEASPLDAVGGCPWPAGTAGGSSWDQAVALRAELEAAAI